MVNTIDLNDNEKPSLKIYVSEGRARALAKNLVILHIYGNDVSPSSQDDDQTCVYSKPLAVAFLSARMCSAALGQW